MTAAAARAVGLDCVLVLSARSADPPLQGNLLLDRLFGATVHFIRANPERAARLVNDAATLLGLSVRVDPPELITDQRFIGEGYGIPSAECLQAINLPARSEAILLDPCYTGKGMAGLIHDVRAGAISPDETVMFLHAGGAPALFSQSDPEALVR